MKVTIESSVIPKGILALLHNTPLDGWKVLEVDAFGDPVKITVHGIEFKMEEVADIYLEKLLRR